MDCRTAQRIIIQPVSTTDDRSAARRHMMECPACASSEDAAVEEALGHRLSQLREPGGNIRLALFLAGGLQTFLALPWIFGATPLWGPTGDTAVAHLTRDGVIGLVLGLVGIAVGLQPRLAYFALSVCGVLVSLQLVAFIADRTSDKVHPIFETIHILSIIISVLVVIVAFPRRHRQ